MATPNDDGEQESRRILRRIARESEAGGRFFERAANDVQRHFGAGDVDPSDRIEVWGTRIGRTLGIVIAIGMMLWVGAYLTGHI